MIISVLLTQSILAQITNHFTSLFDQSENDVFVIISTKLLIVYPTINQIKFINSLFPFNSLSSEYRTVTRP